MPQHKALNLFAPIREQATAYFRACGISWHQHANHALSSQVSCINFLMPLATQPALLSRVIGKALGIAPPAMLPVESGPDGSPWFVGFEWIGCEDYLTEAGRSGTRTRGANATSADAIVRFETAGGIETALIEWKYTESYGAPIPTRGNDVRVARYKDLAFAPNGPVRTDTGLTISDFFWEPFYQLLRQQMLAFRMQAASEHHTTRVRVLHVAPSANLALHNVTAPALQHRGSDAFDVFRGLLVRPDDFVSRSTEAVFGEALSDAVGDSLAWAAYLRERYQWVCRD
ncbi:MAG: hypothetical protein K1X53_17550 [Candidatus Sumerlaeaceae bacterium]|nr:hypothetical protein [Candidatus Sumerlaeaceae bacterium]